MSVGRYSPTFVHEKPLRIFIQPSFEIAAEPLNSLTHTVFLEWWSLAYVQSESTTRDVSTTVISELTKWSLIATISLMFFFQRPRGWRVRAAQKDKHMHGPRGGQGVPPTPCPLGSVPCGSAASNNL